MAASDIPNPFADILKNGPGAVDPDTLKPLIGANSRTIDQLLGIARSREREAPPLSTIEAAPLAASCPPAPPSVAGGSGGGAAPPMGIMPQIDIHKFLEDCKKIEEREVSRGPASRASIDDIDGEPLIQIDQDAAPPRIVYNHLFGGADQNALFARAEALETPPAPSESVASCDRPAAPPQGYAQNREQEGDPAPVEESGFARAYRLSQMIDARGQETLYHCGTRNPSKIFHRPRGSNAVQLPDVFKTCPQGCQNFLAKGHTPFARRNDGLVFLLRYLRDGESVALTMKGIEPRLGHIRIETVCQECAGECHGKNVYIREFATGQTYCCGILWAKMAYLEAVADGMIDDTDDELACIADQLSLSTNCYRYMYLMDMGMYLLQLLQVHENGIKLNNHVCNRNDKKKRAYIDHPPETWTRDYVRERFREYRPPINANTTWKKNTMARIAHLEGLVRMYSDAMDAASAPPAAAAPPPPAPVPFYLPIPAPPLLMQTPFDFDS